jgi:hypothetical protein
VAEAECKVAEALEAPTIVRVEAPSSVRNNAEFKEILDTSRI